MELDIEQTLLLAIDAHRAGKLQVAESLYRDILQIQPMHPDANHNLGVIAATLKQPAAALPFFKTALESNRGHGQYWISYVEALIIEKQFDNAKSILEQGRKMGLTGEGFDALEAKLSSMTLEGRLVPTDLDSLWEHYNNGRYDISATLATKILQEFPNHQLCWKLLGAALQKTGKSDESLTAATRAVELVPNDAEAHYCLGVTLGALGRLDEAAASYRKSLALNPNFAEAHNNLGNTLKALGNLEGAESSFRKVVALKPELYVAHINLGITLQDLGNVIGAENCFRKAIALAPDFAEGHFNLGNALKALGTPEAAEASYRNALALKPDYAECHSNLGSTLIELGKLEDAEASYRKVIEMNPDLAEAHNNLGLILVGKDKLIEGLAHLRHALKRSNLVSTQIGISNVLGRLVPGWHIPMMNERVRNDFYHSSLRSLIRPNYSVFEIGTGSGLLSMMAAELGAASVTTCESVLVIAETAQKIIKTNGFEDKIKLLPKKSTDVVVGEDLPAKQDLLVAEIFSNELLAEHVLPSIEDAKRRLLQPGARIIPAVGSVMVALFGGESAKNNLFARDAFGFDLREFNSIVSRKVALHTGDVAVELFSKGVEAFRFEFEERSFFPVETKNLLVPIKTSGTCCGIIQWIRLEMTKELMYENHPLETSNISHWQCMAYLLPEPVDIKAGATAIISASHNRTNPWFTLKTI